MMRYIYSPSKDPYWNLALEQYVFDSLDKTYDYFMLWQNDNAIIIGKFQNTSGEINPAFVKEHGIRVARRLSGGGAVYHDLGNLNFTFIADNKGSGFNFSTFCMPVVRALDTLGVKAEISGRNDMTIDGKKFSGNSMYMKSGRVMHHGTIMYDSNLEMLVNALNVPKDKIETKGIKSVKSRVTNIKPYMANENLPIESLVTALRDFMFEEYEMGEYTLSQKDLNAVKELRDKVYSTWEWNYGYSPKYSIHKERRIDGVGKVEVYMNVQQGVICDIRFYGDFFGNGEQNDIISILKGCRIQEEELRRALSGINLENYFRNINLEDFISVLLT